MSLESLLGLKRRRGFNHFTHVARAAGSKGATKAHQHPNKSQRCHEWNSETAREAARKRWEKAKENCHNQLDA